MPPEELRAGSARAPIPTAPAGRGARHSGRLVAPPARRPPRRAPGGRPVRQIGIAEADFYPAFSINGTLGYSAEQFPDLFRPAAFNGNVGPSFQWNILNYGRILNNVRLQDARFQELVATYQQTVLNANQEVENGLVTFLRAQQRTNLQTASVDDAEKAVKIVLAQYEAGTVDFTRVTQLEQNLVQAAGRAGAGPGRDRHGSDPGLRALGGGWQIRCTDCVPKPLLAENPACEAAGAGQGGHTRSEPQPGRLPAKSAGETRRLVALRKLLEQPGSATVPGMCVDFRLSSGSC